MPLSSGSDGMLAQTAALSSEAETQAVGVPTKPVLPPTASGAPKDANVTQRTTVRGEETTAHEEETAARSSGPPHSTLTYGGQAARSPTSAPYCWGMCADGKWTVPPRRQPLYVPSGSEMVFRYEAPRPPKKVSVSAKSFDEKDMFGAPVGSPRRLYAHGSGVERTIPAELPPGEYGLYVYVTAPQGDPYYVFRVVVQ
jgi:hypothetical protein